MSNEIFPTLAGITYPVIKRPSFSTLVQESVSGKKKKIANWLYPKWEIEIPCEFLRDDTANNELKTLLGFFLARKGSFDSFLFDDRDDNFISGQQIGIGDGETQDYQLIRDYGGFIEPCLNIKALPVPKIYIDDVLQESGYSIDLTGVVTFTSPPAVPSVITATFGYYLRCCFVEDVSEYEKFLNAVWSGTIKIESDK